MPDQLIIFGASGDLTARKLIPSLLGAWREGALPEGLQIIGVSRRPKSDEAWREELAQWVPEEDAAQWATFSPQIRYVAADGTTADGAATLREALDPAGGWMFYLSLKPSLFEPVVTQLSEAGMLRCAPGEAKAWRRVVVEKPFGHDLPSAQDLNRALLTHLREDQLYRIDHYLGKETVQNILAFRFQNSIFEPLWNRKHVESVEISVCESVDVGERGDYYDQSGALRDMVQNHLMQVLALVAMEAPASMAAEAVRDEKIKVLRSLTTMTPAQVAADVVRAQYDGYRDAPGVSADSQTETYVAIRAEIHNWRWSGVPFFLRTGKALRKKFTEVILRFRTPPVDLLGGPTDGEACALRPNALHILIQPYEQIRLGFLVKQPGPGTLMRPAQLSFDYRDIQSGGTPPAYQRLLVDALHGNATLFIRGDEVEAAWRFVDAIAAGWAAESSPVASYPTGSDGPDEADDLFRGCEGIWGRGEES
ncbi:MAG: glucose-6-phosphate 1-dehydrogenase [Myxococcota bacterium]